jgi:O-antigen ligase
VTGRERATSLALVLLVAGVAWRWGGYDPWAVLMLELGAAGLWVAGAAAWLLREETDSENRLARLRAFRKLSFWVRHPELAGAIRFATLGFFPARRESADIEILLPGAQGARSIELDPAREVFFFGHPVKRTGLFAPLALVSLWIVLSLVPLERGWLDLLSPEAAKSRAEVERLLEVEPAATAPSTLAPFLTFESLWLWLAVLAVFTVSLGAARGLESASRLGLLLLLLGALSGALGVFGFFSDLAGGYGLADESFRARGSFGNPNHYACFQAMLLLVSVGWLSYFRTRRDASRRGSRRRSAGDESSLAFIAGLGILFLSLGLVLSLSRSGIGSAIAGVCCFVLLTRQTPLEGRKRRQALLALSMVVLVVIAFALWIGIEPLVGRFRNLGEQWENEGTRIQVWRDSAPALSDYWLTGSGLGTFRYVGSRYRTFGGVTFYSWAHNDFLQLGIELGVPGLLLLGWIGVAVARGARRARRDLAEEPERLHLHAGFVSAAAAVTLHSAADFSLHLPANLALLAVIVAGVVGMERRRR